MEQETFLLVAIIVVALIYFLFFRNRGGSAGAKGPEARVGERSARAPAKPRRSPPSAADADELVPESIDVEDAQPRAPRPLSQPPAAPTRTADGKSRRPPPPE